MDKWHQQRTGIDDVIAWYMNEIADLEADLEGHEEDLAIVEAYITYLNEIDVRSHSRLQRSLLYCTCGLLGEPGKNGWAPKRTELYCLEISYAEDFAAATAEEYTRLKTASTILATPSMKQKLSLQWLKRLCQLEAYKEKLARELSVLEDELTVYQKKADKFYALVNSELDNTGGNATVTEE